MYFNKYQLEFSERQQVFHYSEVGDTKGVGYIILCKEISLNNLIDFQNHIDNLKLINDSEPIELTNNLVIKEFHNFLKT